MLLFILFAYIHSTCGHGYLRDPPQRSSLWRFYPGHFPPNYNDNSLNCGGRLHQWYVNNGLCGNCGDPYDDARQHEDGGYYDSGFVSRNYTTGSTIILTVRITSNHRGWFEFKLCPHDNLYGSLETCFNKHILEFDGGEKQYRLGRASGDIEVKVKLPTGLTCKRCILQWKYNTGNSWGCSGGNCCIGCGHQEQFYNCADIGIYDWEGEQQTRIKTPPMKIHSVTPVKVCEPSLVYKSVPGMKSWCQNTCPFCPKTHCICKYEA